MYIDNPSIIKLQVEERQRRLRVAGQRLERLDETQLRALVAEHDNKPLFERLCIWTDSLPAAPREKNINYLVYEEAKRRVVYIDNKKD